MGLLKNSFLKNNVQNPEPFQGQSGPQHRKDLPAPHHAHFGKKGLICHPPRPKYADRPVSALGRERILQRAFAPEQNPRFCRCAAAVFTQNKFSIGIKLSVWEK